MGTPDRKIRYNFSCEQIVWGQYHVSRNISPERLWNRRNYKRCVFRQRIWVASGDSIIFDDTVYAYLVALSAFRPLSFLNLFIPIVDYLCANGLYESKIADQINTSAFSWLDQNKNKAPFFLLIHYFDPHDPYLPEELGISKNVIPEQIRKKYANRTVNYTDLESSIIYSVQRGKKPLLPEEKALLVDNYDREINLLDKKDWSVAE